MNEQAQEMYNDLVQKVQQWSIDRNLHTADPSKQFLKVVEEYGETASSDNLHDFMDGVGDTLVTLIILAQQTGNKLELDHEVDNLSDTLSKKKVLELLGGMAATLARGNGVDSKNLNQLYTLVYREHHNPALCLFKAYNEIKDRKGKMIDGVFVKEEDL